MDDKLPFKYSVAIERGGRGTLVDWGHAPGWLSEYGELLEAADRISLIPKPGIVLPVVTVALGNGKRWILFSRVFGQATSGRQIRTYAIGWQKTVGNENVKNIMWVYPTGAVESADEPSRELVRRFLS